MDQHSSENNFDSKPDCWISKGNCLVFRSLLSDLLQGSYIDIAQLMLFVDTMACS
jgi:hypothetical protein